MGTATKQQGNSESGPQQPLAVEMWPSSRPIPYGRNPRRMPAAAVAKVAASLAEFGFRQPIVVDAEDVVIVGHTRLAAAKKLGFQEVPVHVARGLTPAQVAAYRLADNRSAQETDWDAEKLGLELADLAALGLSLELTGFEEDELALYLGADSLGLADPDFIPEPPEPLTRPGDLWLLGAHRLLCGDATNEEDVRRLMGERRAPLLATDPPYLVDYDGGNHPQTWDTNGRRISAEEKTKHWDHYVDPQRGVAFYADYLRLALRHALVARPALYQWFAVMRAELVLEAWRVNRLLPHQILIWHKHRPVLAHCDFMWDYEPCLYGWPQGQRPQPDRRPPASSAAVWELEEPAAREDTPVSGHPTIKPVELFRRPMTWHTRRDEVVYEPFLGSGSTLIAAHIAGRACYALEISPTFCDVALTRWQRFSGERAVLAAREDQGS
jgi:DNA modification methylase